MDTRILNGSGDEDVKVAHGPGLDHRRCGNSCSQKHLCDSGRKIDLVVSHHPSGYAYANFYGRSDGYCSRHPCRGSRPINVAEGLMGESESPRVANKVMPANHTRAVDAAQILGIPFMCAQHRR